MATDRFLPRTVSRLARWVWPAWIVLGAGLAAADDPSPEPEDPAEVEEIQVTAPRPTAADASSAAESVPGERLRQSPRASTLEAVSQEVPWVYVSSRGVGLHGIASGASGGISLRGMGGSPNTQVLVVQDGVPDFQGLFGHPMPDTYVPELLEQVEVISGGDSVLYGTNAMAGVLLFQSRWRTEPGAEFHARTSAGSFNTLTFQPALLGRFGRFDLAVAFHGATSEGHRPGAGGDLQLAQLGTRFWLDDRERITVRLKAAHLAGADPGPLTHPHPGNWFDAIRTSASVEYERFREWGSLRAVTFFSGGRHELYDGFFGLDLVAGAALEGRFQPDRRWQLLAGWSGEHVAGSVENRITGSSEDVTNLTDFALYQQLEYRPTARLTLVAGAREQESLRYGFLFLYKLGVSFSPWMGGELRARLASNFRQPTLRELSLPYPVANPDLKPESSRSVELGFTQKFGRQLSVQATVFHTEARNLIKYFGSWPSATVVNIDQVGFYGVEALLRVRAQKYFELTLGGAWLHVGRYTKQNPDLKLDARLTVAERTWSLSLSGEYVRGLYQNNYGRDPLDDVFFVDLDARYLWEQTGLAVFLVARNLTDHAHAFIEHYRMPGLHFLMGLEVHL